MAKVFRLQWNQITRELNGRYIRTNVEDAWESSVAPHNANTFMYTNKNNIIGPS